MADNERPSKTSVRKAGSKIRKYRSGEASQAEFEEALETVRVFRSQFAGPLLMVTNSVSGIASRCGIDARVTQRLKREQTIIEKLGDREKGLDLSRMQDIGGCRILVSDIAQVRTVEAAILDVWAAQVAKVDDYIEYPRKSGYRAVHIVVKRDNLPIEVQIRSRRMHEWAEFVERMSGHFGRNLKQDAGDHPAQILARTMAEIYRLEEEQKRVPLDLIDKANRQIAEVNKLLTASVEKQEGAS